MRHLSAPCARPTGRSSGPPPPAVRMPAGRTPCHLRARELPTALHTRPAPSGVQNGPFGRGRDSQAGPRAACRRSAATRAVAAGQLITLDQHRALMQARRRGRCPRDRHLAPARRRASRSAHPVRRDNARERGVGSRRDVSARVFSLGYEVTVMPGIPAGEHQHVHDRGRRAHRPMASGAINALRTGQGHVRVCDTPAAAVKDNSPERLPQSVTSSTGYSSVGRCACPAGRQPFGLGEARTRATRADRVR